MKNSEFFFSNAGDTYENLQNEIKVVFSNDNLDNTLHKALDKAIDVGQSLGVLTMTDNLVRIPFSYNNGSPCPGVTTKRVLLAEDFLVSYHN